MIRYKSVTKTVEEIISVKCDRCGKEYDALDFEAQEFHHIKFTGGYASIFGDGTEVECDLCQYCLHEMIGDICRRKEATVFTSFSSLLRKPLYEVNQSS